MSLKYKNVLSPVGQADNQILREMFEDLDFYTNGNGTDYLAQSDLEPSVNKTIDAHQSVMVAPYYKIASGNTLKIGAGSYFYIYEAINNGYKIIQTVTSYSTTAFTTTSSSYQKTNCAATIQPQSLTSKIRITVSGILRCAANAVTSQMSLFRDVTDLDSTTNGFQEVHLAGSTLTVILVPCSVVYIDSPSSTTPITYSIQIKNNNNSTTVGFGNGFTTSIILEEIGV